MSAKSLAPIALGIGALYLFSTKGSPFAQQPRKPGAKPGGEHVDSRKRMVVVAEEFTIGL